MYTLLDKPYQVIRRWLGLFQPDRIEKDADARKSIYTVHQLMYDGAVYFNSTNGGCLEDVLRTYCGLTDTADCRIVPHFLPAKGIVDFCTAAVIPRQGGVEVRPVEQGKPGDALKPITGPLLDALTTIWRDSNLA